MRVNGVFLEPVYSSSDARGVERAEVEALGRRAPSEAKQGLARFFEGARPPLLRAR